MFGVRHDWKDGEITRLFDPEALDRIVYDQAGTLFCVRASVKDARLTELTPWNFEGFEAERETLKML